MCMYVCVYLRMTGALWEHVDWVAICQFLPVEAAEFTERWCRHSSSGVSGSWNVQVSSSRYVGLSEHFVNGWNLPRNVFMTRFSAHIDSASLFAMWTQVSLIVWTVGSMQQATSVVCCVPGTCCFSKTTTVTCLTSVWTSPLPTTTLVKHRWPVCSV